jgi:hypothetical protein
LAGQCGISHCVSNCYWPILVSLGIHDNPAGTGGRVVFFSGTGAPDSVSGSLKICLSAALKFYQFVATSGHSINRFCMER